MIATEILMSEHRVIERVISALETAADQLDAGQMVDAGFFIQAADFIRGFADGCHHRKEEGVLFKALAANGLSEDVGPVAVMLADHEQGRRYTRGMREAALAFQVGDPQAKGEILRNARGYTELLRQHIHKEDRVLFPLADRVIPVGEQDQVSLDFEKVEHEETGEGIHEKYLALADQLEQEIRQVECASKCD